MKIPNRLMRSLQILEKNYIIRMASKAPVMKQTLEQHIGESELEAIYERFWTSANEDDNWDVGQHDGKGDFFDTRTFAQNGLDVTVEDHGGFVVIRFDVGGQQAVLIHTFTGDTTVQPRTYWEEGTDPVVVAKLKMYL